jgi:hypothetical protein
MKNADRSYRQDALLKKFARTEGLVRTPHKNLIIISDILQYTNSGIFCPKIID